MCLGNNAQHKNSVKKQLS